MPPKNGERPPPLADDDLSIERFRGQLKKEFTASRRRSQAPRIPRERLRHLARRVHALGPRPLYELLRELEAGLPLVERLEVYARLGDLADFIKQLGGDRLPIARVVKPSRDEGGRR
jgi:hypothetical protein